MRQQRHLATLASPADATISAMVTPDRRSQLMTSRKNPMMARTLVLKGWRAFVGTMKHFRKG